jgi:hypothetical protein
MLVDLEQHAQIGAGLFVAEVFAALLKSSK